MTIKPFRCCNISALIISILLFTIPTVWATEVESFVNELKKHYQKAPTLKAFSLKYHYLGKSQQGWDYQAPERYMSARMVEIDLVKEHFFENDIHHFSGGRTFNRVQFQNDKESLFYDKNGLALGKRILRQSMDTFEEMKSMIFKNVDFLAVKPLLEENSVATIIKFHHDEVSGKTTLTHRASDDSIIDYVFNDNPIQLLSTDNQSQNQIHIYDDYQTTNGITFARSILKYYDGVTQPSFVHRIDQLDIIDKIDDARFSIPEGFGPVIPESDKTLVSKEIATNLYLITDAAAWRNVLFKVNGEEIMVFGAPISAELAEQTIGLISKQFPDKKITSVYVTHPHSDHIAGLPAYAQRGITIRADAYSVAAIKAYSGFSEHIEQFKFQVIEHDQLLDGVRFYVLENAHSKRQSFVHFKDCGIIYQADFIEVAFDNAIAKIIPSYTKTFVDFVRSQGLEFHRIVGHHRNNNISVDAMNKTYDAIQ